MRMASSFPDDLTINEVIGLAWHHFLRRNSSARREAGILKLCFDMLQS